MAVLAGAGSALTWRLSGAATGDAPVDIDLVALEEQADLFDRALYTEISGALTSHVTGVEPDTAPGDLYAESLAQAVDTYGLENLRIPADTGNESAEQMRSLFEDPVGRLGQAREQLQHGSLPDATNEATFDTLRQALHDFEAEAPELYTDPGVADEARKFAEAVAMGESIPRIPNDRAADDPARVHLEAMRYAAEALEPSPGMFLPMVIPVVLGVVSGVALIGAVIAWIAFARSPRRSTGARPYPQV
jgi:hypothetical protein